MNPYKVLGLEEGAPFEDVRRRYKELAKQNHPDRHQHMDLQERLAKEEYFKKVTVAYHVIVDEMEKEDVKNNTQPTYNWSAMKEVLMNTFVDVATKYLTKRDHRITVPVSLEDYYMKKRKKLQIFLKDVQDPVILTIVCDRECIKTDIVTNDGNVHHIIMQLHIQDHDMFCMQGKDIVATVLLHWDEYIGGKVIDCMFLDGNSYTITIPPFAALGEAVMHPSGKFKVHADIICPSEQNWFQLDESEREVTLNIFKKLRTLKS